MRLIKFMTNTAIKRQAKYPPQEEVINLMSKMTLTDAVQKVTEDFFKNKKVVRAHILSITRDAPSLKANLDVDKYDIAPEGNIPDWRWNRSHRHPEQHKIVTTTTLWESVKKYNKLCKTPEQKELYNNTVRALTMLEHDIELLEILYPIYAINVAPTEIEDKRYNPNIPVTEQTLPGFLWRRLNGRSMTPLNIDYESIVRAVPLYEYRLVKTGDKYTLNLVRAK